MGWWGHGIMAGDTPLDIEGDFVQKFGFEYHEDEPGFDWAKRIPGTKQLTVAKELIEWYGSYGGELVGQVLGFLIMDNGQPMTAEVRKLVLSSVDGELGYVDDDGWSDTSARRSALEEFKALVEKYPAEGVEVEMPEQEGLFDQLAQLLAAQ